MPLSTETHGFIIDPLFSFMDDKGKTIKNGFVRVFLAGSSTPAVTYLNWAGSMNQETIQLDNSGRVATAVIGQKDRLYKVCVYDLHHSQETPILTVDNVQVLGTVMAILDNSVTTAKIVDEAVTNAKLHDNAVTESKIEDDSISTAKLKDGSVIGAKIAAGAITEEKIEDSFARKILNFYVTPEMYGAVADAGSAYNGEMYTDNTHTQLSTDNTAAFQAAVNSGYPVVITGRRYFFRGALSFSGSMLNISSPYLSVLFFKSNIPAFITVNARFSIFKNFQVQTFETNTSSVSIDITAVSACKFEDIRVYYGAYGFRCDTNSHIYVGSFYRCRAEYQSETGFELPVVEPTAMNNAITLLDCVANENNVGMYVKGRGLNIIGGDYEGNSAGGIELGANARSVRIEGVYFERNVEYNIKVNPSTYDPTIGTNYYNEFEKKVDIRDIPERCNLVLFNQPIVQNTSEFKQISGQSISNVYKLSGVKLPCVVSTANNIDDYNQYFDLGIEYNDRVWSIFPTKSGAFFKAKVTAINGTVVSLDSALDATYIRAIGAGIRNPLKPLADAGLDYVASVYKFEYLSPIQSTFTSGSTTVDLGTYLNLWQLRVGDYIFFGQANTVQLGYIRYKTSPQNLTVPAGYEFVENPVIYARNDARYYDVCISAQYTPPSP